MKIIDKICERLSNKLNVMVNPKPETYELEHGNRLYVNSKKTRIFIDDYVLKIYENNIDELILTIKEYFEQHVIKK